MRSLTLIAAAWLLSAAAMAQTPTAASPAKKELVQKLLALQQPGIENAARSIVERPAAQMMQEAGRVLQTQFPADKREGIGKAIEADARKYVEEAYPPVRERALKLAPTTIGATLEEKFTEDELKQLIAWFESPVNKKFQQVGARCRTIPCKLVADARPLIEPKLQTLNRRCARRSGPPAAAAPADSGTAPKAAARPPAKAASK